MPKYIWREIWQVFENKLKMYHKLELKKSTQLITVSVFKAFCHLTDFY